MHGMPQMLDSSVTAVSLASARWWHLGCLSASADERDTTELADPNGRCAECIADRRYAMSRILELVRTESGEVTVLTAWASSSTLGIVHSMTSTNRQTCSKQHFKLTARDLIHP